MDQQELLEQFIGQRGLTVPDHRPLYAYKCSEREYAITKSLIRKMLPRVLAGYDFRRFHEIFCLFAAETWRREYSGGVFAYRTIFATLGVIPERAHVRDWITLGLNWWGREIIQGEGGTQRFLLTIACEGGIPMRLLHNADTRLSNYFRALLTALHEGGNTPIESLARRELMLLPVSLRQEVVFEVSARLVQAIADLQPLIRDADEPIRALNLANPSWRETLPLPLNDSTVELLLGNLLHYAQDLEKKATSQVRWQRTLTRQGDAWTLSSTLSLPDRIKPEQLRQWSGWTEVPDRLRLLLTVSEQTHTVALLSLVTQRDTVPFYRCESVNPRGLTLMGRTAMVATALTISDGVRESLIAVAGEQGLSDLPWVFIQGQAAVGWRLLAEGSVRSRQPEAVVAIDATDLVMPSSGAGESLRIGSLDTVGRLLYRVTGVVQVIAADGDRCTIRCAADQDTADTYLLSGKQLSVAIGCRLPYLGAPRVYAVDQNNRSRPLSSTALSWSPAGTGSLAWSADIARCVGRVWIRATDPDGGATLLRRCIDVTPPGTKVTMRVGSGTQGGFIDVSGLEGGQVEVSPSPGLTVAQTEMGARLEFDPQASPDLSSIALRLSWPGRTSINILLPAPKRGGAFVHAGRILGDKELVAMERLGGMQAVARGPEGSGRYYVEATLRSAESGDADLQRLLWLRLPLQDRGQGEFQIPLHLTQELLASLLAMVPDVNARARLVLSDSVQALSCIEVARYDLELTPQRDAGRVCLPLATQVRLADDWQETVTLQMFPLWDLVQPPTTLARDPDPEVIAWQVPQGLATGPWWVVGRDGGWARFRPLLWTVHSTEDEQAEAESMSDTRVSGLTQAIRHPVAVERESMLDSLIQDLFDNPDATDWERLFGYIRLTREHPANTLEIIKRLVQCPRTLALTLLKASENDFDLVWSLAQTMPFAWFLLPKSCWMAAAKAHFGGLRDALAGIAQGDSIIWDTFDGFRQRTVRRLRCFGILCDWLQESLLPERTLLDQTLRQARLHPEQIAFHRNLQEPLLLGRHAADEQWPQGPRVMEQMWNISSHERFENRYAPYRAVLCAPFVAAHACLTDQKYPDSVVFELRRLRDFDTDWFDDVVTIQLCLGLAAA
ncbi:STY4851/ECs_5259 family protein [uncultured Lamprocystis sp.]|jgi:hypothetical protein|uniref:STY4851/ECs_5259 family protein n=1 Tax=uncultured Lamprocystis sp. TaxID=543132 RepID=UPI0025D11D79|nr:STY4851/ECs_5259 family protein [uncultured Lamprocystis sp.]